MLKLSSKASIITVHTTVDSNRNGNTTTNKGSYASSSLLMKIGLSVSALVLLLPAVETAKLTSTADDGVVAITQKEDIIKSRSSCSTSSTNSEDDSSIGDQNHHQGARMCNNDAATTDDEQSEEEEMKKHRYKWNPQDEHPCTIERLTFNDIFMKFGIDGIPPLHEHPLVIINTAAAAAEEEEEDGRNELFRYKTHIDNIINEFPIGFNVTLTSSNSFSEHRRIITLEEYINEQITMKETLPSQLSNETWYLFGETFTKPWKKLLSSYELPPCIACQRNDDLIALSFGIGNIGSGVQWHVHGPGFSESIHGRKHWILQKERPVNYHPDQTSRNYMEYEYTSIVEQHGKGSSSPLPFYECTLNPGDIIYFPNMWWHATINLDVYTAFVSTFTQEHLFV